jgi:hypothetical protein
MPTTEQNKNMINRQTKVQEMRNSAADTVQTAGEITGASLTLHDDVMKEVRADRASRGASKMAEDIGMTTGQLVQDPLDIRDRTRGVVNPEDVNALTKSARASNLGTLATQATQAEYNQGSLAEIIEAGANQLKQRAAILMAEAENESAKADALMESLTFEQSEKKREFDEWATREQLRQSANRGDGGGTSAGYDKWGNPDDEAMMEYVNGLMSEGGRFDPKKDPLGNNINAWNAMYDTVKRAFPWVTEADITRATGVAKPGSASQAQATTTPQSPGLFTRIGNWFKPKPAEIKPAEERVAITREESIALYGTPGIPTAPKSEVEKIRKYGI